MFENYIRVGLSEQAQMVGDKKQVSTMFHLAAKNAKKKKVLGAKRIVGLIFGRTIHPRLPFKKDKFKHQTEEA